MVDAFRAGKTGNRARKAFTFIREERKKRQNVTGTDSPHVTIIQDIAEQGSSESNAAGNDQAKSANEQIDEDQSLISIERETVYRYEIIYFDSRRHRLLKILSNDPGKVESNFFRYAATVLSPHRNVLIFTQRMHKPTERPFTR